MTFVKLDRPQTVQEEIANALSHGIGFLLAAATLPIVVVVGQRQHVPTTNLAAVSVFSVTMMLVYLASALYHAVPEGRTKDFLNRVDHAAIFLFIAGSYTPYGLGVLHARWGWTVVGAIWALSVAGIAVKLMDRLKQPVLSTALYVGLGWCALAAAGPALHAMAPNGLLWILGGVLAYSAGAVVFLLDARARYLHFVWHLFVIGGTACHFWAALWYALPVRA